MTLSKTHNFYFRCFLTQTMWKRSFFHIYERVKNGHFLKGLVRGFGPKIKVFPLGVFYRNRIRKDRFLYCGKKIMILSGKIWSFKKGQKRTFFKGVSLWILSKNRTFSYRCFSQKLCQKRSFLDILNRQQSFVD